jgi:hypothetical protein
VDFYAYLQKTAQSATNRTWNDIDALGATEDRYFFFETSALDDADPRVSVGYVSNADGDPYFSQCPNTDVVAGVSATYVTAVMRWDFTNA